MGKLKKSLSSYRYNCEWIERSHAMVVRKFAILQYYFHSKTTFEYRFRFLIHKYDSRTSFCAQLFEFFRPFELQSGRYSCERANEWMNVKKIRKMLAKKKLETLTSCCSFHYDQNWKYFDFHGKALAHFVSPWCYWRISDYNLNRFHLLVHHPDSSRRIHSWVWSSMACVKWKVEGDEWR